MTPEDVLKSVYGFETFRPGQKEAIISMSDGNDTIVLIPTGEGKTVTFSIPSMMRPGGISIVVSPLIMLMYDQVARLREVGINTCYYNDLLSDAEKDFVLHNLQQPNCQYEFIFVSPESALTDKFIHCLDKLYENKHLNFIIIEEAHCVAEWGEEFRPKYTELGTLRKPGIPIAALTGTATSITIDVIKSSFFLKEPKLIRLSCLRKNLAFNCIPKEMKQPKQNIVNDVYENHFGQCGIIYCNTQNKLVS